MNSPNLWNQLLVWPIINVLVALYKGFEYLHVPGPLGFAVIGLTLLIRLLLYPLMQAQLKSAKKMANLKPHMDALNVKHKGDKQALQQAQLALYKEHGINPAAGCLPLLVQMPVLIALYSVFNQVLNNTNISTVVKSINQVVYSPSLQLKTIDLTFFHINLGIKPSQWQTHGLLLLSVPIITGLLQWYQTRLMMATTPGTPNVPAIPETVKKQKNKNENPLSSADLPAGKAGATEGKDDTAAEMQKQMAIIMPIMFGYFAFQFPLGLALYWNVFGLFGIMQQLQINKQK